MSRPAIFLDRDGVIVESSKAPGAPVPPDSVQDATIPFGVREALHNLHAAGFVLVVVTNQPDVARGSTTQAAVDAINDKLRSALPLDAVYVCTHDGSACSCRKPRPGMLLEATRDLDLDLRQSWMIGDRWVDIAAGEAAGVHTVLIEGPYSWEPTRSGGPPDDLAPDHIVASVTDAAEIILGATG